jgi:hypothetical protein
VTSTAMGPGREKMDLLKAVNLRGGRRRFRRASAPEPHYPIP